MASHPYTAVRAALDAAANAFVAAGNRAEYKDRRAFRSREKQLRGKGEWWIEQMEGRLEEDWWRTWTLAEQNALLADLARVKGQYEHSTLAKPGLERMVRSFLRRAAGVGTGADSRAHPAQPAGRHRVAYPPPDGPRASLPAPAPPTNSTP